MPAIKVLLAHPSGSTTGIEPGVGSGKLPQESPHRLVVFLDLLLAHHLLHRAVTPPSYNDVLLSSIMLKYF
jgi:hypothetical protein